MISGLRPNSNTLIFQFSLTPSLRRTKRGLKRANNRLWCENRISNRSPEKEGKTLVPSNFKAPFGAHFSCVRRNPIRRFAKLERESAAQCDLHLKANRDERLGEEKPPFWRDSSNPTPASPLPRSAQPSIGPCPDLPLMAARSPRVGRNGKEFEKQNTMREVNLGNWAIFIGFSPSTKRIFYVVSKARIKQLPITFACFSLLPPLSSARYFDVEHPEGSWVLPRLLDRFQSFCDSRVELSGWFVGQK